MQINTFSDWRMKILYMLSFMCGGLAQNLGCKQDQPVLDIQHPRGNSWQPLRGPSWTQTAVLYHLALDGYVSLPDSTPHTCMMMSLNIMQHSLLQPMASSLYLLLFTSIHPFCFCPDCFHPSWPTTDKHTLSWFPWSLAIIHDLATLAQTCGTYHWGRMWRMWWRRDNRDPKRNKVPLMEKCI